MERKILHVDVNNAFLSWSAIYRLQHGEKLDIRTIPAVIGGDESARHGIVLAKSMLAKSYGVVTGETLYQARIKCPNLQVFPANREFYHECSNKLYKLLLKYTDHIERFSIDECFLDMTNFLMDRTIEDIAREINMRVKKELGFTVNIGIAPNKLLAKMASDFAKPDRIHTLYKNEIETKMWPLPISELLMLGKKTIPKLDSMGIKTIGDLAKTDYKLLCRRFGKQGDMLWKYANGIDNSEVVFEEERPKGIGNSTTLPQDISNKEELLNILLSLTEQVTYRLRKEEMLANTVSVQLRTNEFENFSHQGKLNSATSSTKDIFEKAKKLLDEMYKSGMRIRLIGVRVDGLVEKGEEQISLFTEEKDERQEKIDKALDEIRDKRINGLYKGEENKKKKECRYLLEKLHKNCKIYFEMSSIDKTSTIDFYREHKNTTVCNIGECESDFDSIITSNVGISIKKPTNINTILCHFYSSNTNISCIKNIILEGRVLFENNILLEKVSFLCSMALNSYILCCLIRNIDTIESQLNFLEIEYLILAVFSFSGEPKEGNMFVEPLVKNRKLLSIFYLIELIGVLLVKLLF